MATNIKRIPKFAVDNKNKFSETQFQATNFPISLYPYDGFDEGSGTGFSSKEGFIGTVISTQQAPIFEISLSPSARIITKDFTVKAKYIKNITSYSQKVDEIASVIYSQSRPVYHIKNELDLRDILTFWTTEDIMNSKDTSLKISDDVEIYVVDSYDPQYDGNGVFQYATLTLKRVISYQARKTSQDGSGKFEYIEFNWYRKNIQPTNVKRHRRVWKSRPILWLSDYKNGDNVSSKWKWTPHTKGAPLVNPFLPIKGGGTELAFIPSWINEMGYWQANQMKIGVSSKGWPLITFNRNVYIENILGNSYIWISTDGIFKESVNGGLANIIGQERKNDSFYFGSKYRINRVATFGIFGGDGQRQNLFDLTFPTMDLATPFNFFGYRPQQKFLSHGGSDLPRPDHSNNAAWKNTLSQSYAFFDVLIDYQQYAAAQSLAWYPSDVVRNENGEKNMKRISTEIVNGASEMFGFQLTTKPPSTYESNFDTSSHPRDWNLDDMLRYTGVFFSETRILLDGSLNEFNLPAIKPSDLLTSSKTVEVSWIFGQTITSHFGLATNVKSRASKNSWYLNNGKEWIEEKEFDKVIDKLISYEAKYFGGYEYTDYWYSNSYEDSLIAGDTPCTYTFNGKEFAIPGLLSRAANRRGNPLSYGEKKIWGTQDSLSFQAKQDIITKRNIKEEINNSKTLININTGKRIKNKKFKRKKK